MNLIDIAETGLFPDALIRIGIRRLLAQRLETSSPDVSSFAEQLRCSPLAVDTEAANQQHYEVPAEFFEKMLGPRLKYSACFFDSPTATLAEAEEAMLRKTCQRADIVDGMRILELGCGWGSLTLWIAQHAPNCEITAVSNSASQRKFIERRAREAGINNIRVITADMRDFSTREKFDRVLSVEMFEHMRNYELLFRRVASWLSPEGKAFVHVFAHRNSPYLFATEGAANWMGRHFFTGGQMPSEDLFRHFGKDLAIVRQWRVSGLHYWRTCEAWLRNLDHHREFILDRFQQDVSRKAAKTNLQRWRIFLMACAELFRFRQGDEWFVSHYLFEHARPSLSGSVLVNHADFAAT